MNVNAANWYPDPSNRHQLRYWNGAAWTEHVSDNGATFVDPLPPAPPMTERTAGESFGAISESAPVVSTTSADRVRRQVGAEGFRGAGLGAVSTGGGTVFTEPVLVVNQKAKLIELSNQYAVFDGQGRQIGSVNQVGQSTAKKVLRALTNIDQFLTHRLDVTDMAGTVQLRLTRPAKVFKSTVVVSDGADREIGRIVQENMIGKIHFRLESGGQVFGAIRAENWRAWNFRIEDAGGTEVARITKTWEGVAKTLFTTADNYVVQIHQQLTEPLRSLVVAAALSVDTALKQDSRGLG